MDAREADGLGPGTKPRGVLDTTPLPLSDHPGEPVRLESDHQTTPGSLVGFFPTIQRSRNPIDSATGCSPKAGTEK